MNKVWLEKKRRYLSRPLDRSARGILLAAALLLIAGCFLPLWRIDVITPASPARFGLAVHADRVDRVGASAAPVEVGTDGSADSRWLPLVIGGLALLCLRAGAIGTGMSLVDVFALFGYFMGFSIWSFAGRLDFYGRYLATATSRGTSIFVPPLFGRETVDGILVSSLPAAGALAVAAAGLLLAFAVVVTWRSARSEMASEARMAA